MKISNGDILLDKHLTSNPYYVINNPIYKTTKLMIEIGFNIEHNQYEEPYIYSMFTKTINKLLNTKEMLILFHWEEK